jgi:hypothetical protein
MKFTILGLITSMKEQYEEERGVAPKHLYISEDVYDAIESQYTAQSNTKLDDDCRIVEVCGMFIHSSPYNPWHEFTMTEFAL